MKFIGATQRKKVELNKNDKTTCKLTHAGTRTKSTSESDLEQLRFNEKRRTKREKGKMKRARANR